MVCHHPDPALLQSVLDAVAPQVARVLVVANDGHAPPGPLPAGAEVVVPPRNLGLGAAYNLALRWAAEHDATHLLLLDQDSVPAPGMVAFLRAAFDGTPGEKVAAAGPLWRDRTSGRDGHFVQLGRIGVRRCRPPPGSVVPVDFLLSSGTLVGLAAAARIGDFDERLFIDHVDTEWCLRARAAGWTLRGVADARLAHALGCGPFPGPFGTLAPRIAHYPPERTYHLVRNSVALWRRPGVGWAWRIADMRRTAAMVALHLLFAPQRVRRLALTARAVRDSRRLS
ncbi:glycosyltransferase family 2 protein [Rhodoplanes roseus]|uniref:glycosyltransferase family 2 protein n=1 Tax=Rhodoplanes roseus TaxID=29409 RepID=UPI0011B49060|nr:glycosyltransferase family 2 protein [Rhodoplanes roseus]